MHRIAQDYYSTWFAVKPYRISVSKATERVHVAQFITLKTARFIVYPEWTDITLISYTGVQNHAVARLSVIELFTGIPR